jgi:hypothetical protein
LILPVLGQKPSLLEQNDRAGAIAAAGREMTTSYKRMDPDRDVERARPEAGRLIAAGGVREDTVGIFGVALGKYFDAPVNN